MNKYLMMSAAALLGSTLPTLAADQSGAHTIHFDTANGGSYCDGMSFYKSQLVPIVVGTHLNADCNGTNTEVAGKATKTQYSLLENWISNTSFIYDIGKPIRNGGPWELWVCFNGSSCFEANSGTYTIGFPERSAGRLPTTAKVKDIIAERRIRGLASQR